jgi:hypothetical protein
MIADPVMALRNEIEDIDSKEAFNKDVVSPRGFLLNDTSHLDEIKVFHKRSFIPGGKTISSFCQHVFGDIEQVVLVSVFLKAFFEFR